MFGAKRTSKIESNAREARQDQPVCMESLEGRALFSAAPIALPSYDGAGNTPAAAQGLGSISAGQKRTAHDYVGSADTDDYYSITLASALKVKFCVGKIRADADLRVEGDAGTVLAESAHVGHCKESITVTLAAGTYFVRVHSADGGNTPYQLKISAKRQPVGVVPLFETEQVVTTETTTTTETVPTIVDTWDTTTYDTIDTTSTDTWYYDDYTYDDTTYTTIDDYWTDTTSSSYWDTSSYSYSVPTYTYTIVYYY